MITLCGYSDCKLKDKCLRYISVNTYKTESGSYLHNPSEECVAKGHELFLSHVDK